MCLVAAKKILALHSDHVLVLVLYQLKKTEELCSCQSIKTAQFEQAQLTVKNNSPMLDTPAHQNWEFEVSHEECSSHETVSQNGVTPPNLAHLCTTDRTYKTHQWWHAWPCPRKKRRRRISIQNCPPDVSLFSKYLFGSPARPRRSTEPIAAGDSNTHAQRSQPFILQDDQEGKQEPTYLTFTVAH